MNVTKEATCTGGPEKDFGYAQLLGSIESESHDTIGNDTGDRWEIGGVIDVVKKVFERL